MRDSTDLKLPREIQPNLTRQIEAQQKIRRKLEVLRQFDIEGMPAGFAIPNSLADFRSWSDPSRNVQKLGSSGTTDRKVSPHNEELMLEVVELLEKLRRAAQTRTKRTYTPLEQRLRARDSELQVQQRLNGALTSQILALRNDLLDATKATAASEEELAQLRQTADSLRREVLDLSRSLKLGLRRV